MLPAGYRRLEYLESTGTQYIDTGIVPSSAHGLKIDHELTNDVDTIPLGCRNNGSSDTRFYALRAPRNSYLGYGWGAWQTLSPNAEGRRVNSELNWFNSGLAAWQGATRQLSALPFTPTRSLYMFAANVGGTASLISSCRVWKAAISEGGSVKAFFIPCLDDTGTPCMYDKVRHKAFYNQGTGDFIYPTTSATYSLRRVLPDWGKLTEHGLRRLYHTPVWYKGELYDYALENGYKPIVESDKPEEGYWTPKWVESSDEIVLEWIETEAPTEEI